MHREPHGIEAQARADLQHALASEGVAIELPVPAAELPSGLELPLPPCHQVLARGLQKVVGELSRLLVAAPRYLAPFFRHLANKLIERHGDLPSPSRTVSHCSSDSDHLVGHNRRLHDAE